VSGRADKRCRGQRRSIVLAVEVRGFILVVDMAPRIDGKTVVTRVRVKMELMFCTSVIFNLIDTIVRIYLAIENILHSGLSLMTRCCTVGNPQCIGQHHI